MANKKPKMTREEASLLFKARVAVLRDTFGKKVDEKLAELKEEQENSNG